MLLAKMRSLILVVLLLLGGCQALPDEIMEDAELVRKALRGLEDLPQLRQQIERLNTNLEELRPSMKTVATELEKLRSSVGGLQEQLK